LSKAQNEGITSQPRATAAGGTTGSNTESSDGSALSKAQNEGITSQPRATAAGGTTGSNTESSDGSALVKVQEKMSSRNVQVIGVSRKWQRIKPPAEWRHGTITAVAINLINAAIPGTQKNAYAREAASEELWIGRNSIAQELECQE